jgi:mannose-6-phosphate isomerase
MDNGKSLTEVINEVPNEILGTEVYKRFGKQFPLLFKYLDARETCHSSTSNDALAKKRHNSLGKQKCGISCRLIRMLE